MRTFTLFALAAFSAVAVTATSASAEPTSIAVSYADLDLSTPAGMKQLEGRIESASQRICGQVEVRRISDGIDYGRCVQQTHAVVSVELAKAKGKTLQIALNTSR